MLNDVAIRIFDALSSGEIPILPEFMRYLPPLRSMDRRHILFYAPQDIITPHTIVEKVIDLFDSGGLDEIDARHRFALDNHQGRLFDGGTAQRVGGALLVTILGLVALFSGR